jgi:serine/threonine protein kinase
MIIIFYQILLFFVISAILTCGKRFIDRGAEEYDRESYVLKDIHARGFLHRDLKPSNIMLAPNDGGTDGRRAELFVVDFGLAKRFLNTDGSHIAMRQKNGVTGTPRYCSYTHGTGIEPP